MNAHGKTPITRVDDILDSLFDTTGYKSFKPDIYQKNKPRRLVAEANKTMRLFITLDPNSDSFNAGVYALGALTLESGLGFRCFTNCSDEEVDGAGREFCIQVRFDDSSQAYEAGPEYLKHLLLRAWKTLNTYGVQVRCAVSNNEAQPISVNPGRVLTPFSYSMPNHEPLPFEITLDDLYAYGIDIAEMHEQQLARLKLMQDLIRESKAQLEQELHALLEQVNYLRSEELKKQTVTTPKKTLTAESSLTNSTNSLIQQRKNDQIKLQQLMSQETTSLIKKIELFISLFNLLHVADADWDAALAKMQTLIDDFDVAPKIESNGVLKHCPALNELRIHFELFPKEPHTKREMVLASVLQFRKFVSDKLAQIRDGYAAKMNDFMLVSHTLSSFDHQDCERLIAVNPGKMQALFHELEALSNRTVTYNRESKLSKGKTKQLANVVALDEIDSLRDRSVKLIELRERDANQQIISLLNTIKTLDKKYSTFGGHAVKIDGKKYKVAAGVAHMCGLIERGRKNNFPATIILQNLIAVSKVAAAKNNNPIFRKRHEAVKQFYAKVSQLELLPTQVPERNLRVITKGYIQNLIASYHGNAGQFSFFSKNSYTKGFWKRLFDRRTRGIAELEEFLQLPAMKRLPPDEFIQGDMLCKLVDILNRRENRIAKTSHDYEHAPDKKTNRVYMSIYDQMQNGLRMAREHGMDYRPDFKMIEKVVIKRLSYSLYYKIVNQAHAGDSAKQYLLGKALLTGRLVFENGVCSIAPDTDNALNWLRQSSKAQNLDAAFLLGGYYSGVRNTALFAGLPKRDQDKARAKKYFTLAYNL